MLTVHFDPRQLSDRALGVLTKAMHSATPALWAEIHDQLVAEGRARRDKRPGADCLRLNPSQELLEHLAVHIQAVRNIALASTVASAKLTELGHTADAEDARETARLCCAISDALEALIPLGKPA